MVRLLFTLLVCLGLTIPCFAPVRAQSNLEPTHTVCAPGINAVTLVINGTLSPVEIGQSVTLVAEIHALKTLTGVRATRRLSNALKASNSPEEINFGTIDSGTVQTIPISITPIDSSFQKLSIVVRAKTFDNLSNRETEVASYDEVGFFYDKQTRSFRMETMEQGMTTEYRIWNLIPEDSVRSRGHQIIFDRTTDSNLAVARPAPPSFKRRPKLDHKGPYTTIDFSKMVALQQEKDTSVRTNPESEVCVTITGYLYYENYSVAYVPLPNTTVDIYDDDTFWDDYLGSTITNGNGYFSIHVCHDDGIFDTHLEIYAILKTINGRVSVLNYTEPGDPHGFNPFAWATWVIETGGGTISYGNLLISGSTMNRGGAKIFDNMQKAWSASVARGFNPSYTPVVYPAPTSQCGGSSCYSFQTFPWTGLGAIFMQAGEWVDGREDVSYHEYGHALMHRAFANAWYPNTAGGSHTSFPQPAGFAWSEGWATFYTQVVENDGYYQWWADLENRASIIRSDITGEVSEWRVAQAMTDLFDANVDGDDYAQIPFIRFINTMQSNNSGSLSQFWSQLRNSLSMSDKHFGYRSLTYNTISVAYEPPPLIPPVISGFTQTPVPIYRDGSGTVTCNLLQGNGNISYEWTAEYTPGDFFVYFSGNTATIQNGRPRPLGLQPPVKGGPNNPEGLFRLTCTASNGAGSSTRTFYPFIVYDPPPPPPGGCPFVYAWKDSGYAVDNNILPQSQLPENEGHDVTDYYQMFVSPSLDEDKYVLAVGEFENEHSFLDQTKLLVIDHDPDAFVTVDDSGRVIQFAKPAAFADAQLDSTDVLAYLVKLDDVKVEVVENDTMRLRFTREGGEYEEGLLLIGQAAIKEAVAGTVTTNDKQQGVTFTNFRLRRNPSYTWVLVGTTDTSTVQIDIEWKQDAAVDYSELSKKLELPFTLQEATLLSATHSSAGDVTDNLRTWDENYAELMPEEWMRLEFQAPPLTEGMQRSFVFVSRGRYVSLGSKPSLAKGSQPTGATANVNPGNRPVPTEFSVSQNYPNPFNPSTVIRYQIPKGSHVSLRVYDLLGREVAVLVDEPKEAGFYEATFDASGLSSGVYFYRMRAGSYHAVRKLVVLK